MASIQKTKAVLDGVHALAIEVIGLARDGIQVQDAVQLVEDLIQNPEFKAKMTLLVTSVSGVLEEIKDIDLIEGVELAKFEYEAVTSIIAALKKVA